MAVRQALLALLVEGPRQGYQLKTAFEAATGGTWALNVGQVYTTLDRLGRDGLVDVDVDGDDGAKRYVLTSAGREELGGWWETTPNEEPPPRDELVLKVLLAIERGPEHALQVITRQRTALLGLLQSRRRTTRRRRAASVAAALAEDSIVVRAESDLRWLDLCEARVLQGPT